MISILMPVYNTSKELLVPSLEHCLNQTIEEYEVVVIDNGSSNEETIGVLNKYENSHAKVNVYRCERHKNKKNLSVALNFGLTKCRHNLVARIDSDDFMQKERLEKQLQYMNSNKDVTILGGQILILQTGQITRHPPIISKRMAIDSYWFLNHPTVMYRKDKILSIGGYREHPVLFAEDYDLWLRSLSAGFDIHNLQDVLVNYNLHGNNLTRQTEKNPKYFSIMDQARIKFMEENLDIG